MTVLNLCFTQSLLFKHRASPPVWRAEDAPILSSAIPLSPEPTAKTRKLRVTTESAMTDALRQWDDSLSNQRQHRQRKPPKSVPLNRGEILMFVMNNFLEIKGFLSRWANGIWAFRGGFSRDAPAKRLLDIAACGIQSGRKEQQLHHAPTHLAQIFRSMQAISSRQATSIQKFSDDFLRYPMIWCFPSISAPLGSCCVWGPQHQRVLYSICRLTRHDSSVQWMLHAPLSDPFDARGVDWPLRRPPLASTTETHHLINLHIVDSWMQNMEKSEIFTEPLRLAESRRGKFWSHGRGNGWCHVVRKCWKSVFRICINVKYWWWHYNHYRSLWLQHTVLEWLYSWLMTIIATTITIAYHNNALR